MATTLTRNLKLRINSNLTADAKYNLEKIDLLGATFLVDTTDALNIRSVTDINLLPESADVGGSGVGGVVTVGSASQPVSDFVVYADNISFGSGLSLDDQAAGGTKKLRLKYKSDLDGSTDTAADRQLFFDVNAGDRQLVLGANLSILVGNIVLSGQPTGSSVILPDSGTLATLAGVEIFTNKTISAGSNTITGLVNANISNSAAIAYSKLNLSGSIVNADLSASAGIVYSKLVLTGSLVDADISNSASINYSKLNLTGSITNADITAGAGISGSKITPDFGNQIIITQDRLRFQEGGYNIDLRSAPSGLSSNLDFRLPPTAGTTGQVLSTDGTGLMDWVTLPAPGSYYWRDAVANFAALPTGFLVGELRQTLDLNRLYRWNGTIWQLYFDPLISSAVSSVNGQTGVVVLDTDDIPEGATNLYWTNARFDARLALKTTADLTEGSNLYYTDERVDDRVAALLVAGTGISLVYNDPGNSLTINSTITQYTDEMAEDAVGGILTDTASVDLTYNDAGNAITADVIPGGVNHDALLNFVANKHIDHSAVNINTAANSGMSGGGNITTSRSLLVDPTNAPAVTAASGDLVLIADVSAGNALKSVTAQSIADLAASGVSAFKQNWTSGTTITVTHSLGTRDVIVQLYDNVTYETLEVDLVVRTDINNVDLTASSAPSGAGWRVIVLAT